MGIVNKTKARGRTPLVLILAIRPVFTFRQASATDRTRFDLTIPMVPASFLGETFRTNRILLPVEHIARITDFYSLVALAGEIERPCPTAAR